MGQKKHKQRADRNYKKYLRMARENGWATPINNAFGKATWLAYWQQMEAYGKNPDMGRPIAPHRTGGAAVV